MMLMSNKKQNNVSFVMPKTTPVNAIKVIMKHLDQVDLKPG